MSQPTFKLNSGAEIPFNAFGTGTALFNKADETVFGVQQAIKKGFVHLDGAQMYGNEEQLGQAIAASGVPRESLFVTTKLADLPEGKTVEASFRESLDKLFPPDKAGGSERYVDLFLIHAPRLHYAQTLKEVWGQLQKLEGVRTIGVSNAGIPELTQILEVGGIPPAVNQLEVHPYFWSVIKPIHEFNKSKGIITESYGGLTPVVRAKGGPLDPVLERIRDRLASTSGKSVTEGQVLGKWLQNKGIVAISTSSKAERLEEYLAVAGLPDLTAEEVDLIDETGSKHPFQQYKPVFRLTATEDPEDRYK